MVPSVTWAQMSARDLLRDPYRDQQRDAMGSNPYDIVQEEIAEGDPLLDPDSVKPPRIKKPLESYFFGDSLRQQQAIMWIISRNFNEVTMQEMDTTLRMWRVDYPFYKKHGVGDAALGGMGQASLPFSFFERHYGRPDFSFAQPFDAYIYRLENVPFYNLKTPYFQFQYLESGQKRIREHNFGLTLAHNISPTTGFNLQYRDRGTNGVYDWQRQRNANLSIAVSHTGKRYTVHAGYVNNRISSQENGGVVGAWAVRDTTFEMPSGVPMKLRSYEAENEYRNNAFFITQSYGIPLARVREEDFSIARKPVIFVGHSFEYNTWTKKYRDIKGTYSNERVRRDTTTGSFVRQDGLEYYARWYENPAQTRDSLRERRITNRVYVQLQPWNREGVVGTVTGGVGQNWYLYSQFRPRDYVTGRQQNAKESGYFAYAGVGGKISRYVDWGADGEYYFAGPVGDFSLDGHLALTGFIRGKPIRLEGKVHTGMYDPGYWRQHLYSNHYIFDNNFRKEKDTRFEVTFSIPDHAFEVSFQQGVVTDKVVYEYMDSGKTTSTNIPIWDVGVRQATGTTSVTGVYARKDFRVAGLHLDHKVLVQWSSDERVVSVPLVTAFVSYYYEFWVVKKNNALKAQFGFDARYNTKYYAPGYNPAIGEFYNQHVERSGDYPYIDIFLVGKWKRARVFLKYQHFNRGLFGNGDYFAISGYPLNPGMFKFGLSWGFYD